MTDDELERLEALASAATPGPWRLPGGKGYVMPSHGEPYKVAQLGGTPAKPGLIAREDDRLPHDAAFIASAREAVPALVAEVRRLRAATRQAVLEEREACARLAQFTLPAWAPPADPPQKRIADAIRERAAP